MKDYRWWLVLAFALFMARPTKQRCIMCLDRFGECSVATTETSSLNSSTVPTENSLESWLKDTQLDYRLDWQNFPKYSGVSSVPPTPPEDSDAADVDSNNLSRQPKL